MVRIAVDVLTTEAETVRVNKENRKAEQVKAQLCKLNLFHMQYVLSSLGQNDKKAHNIRAVIITSLYNACLLYTSGIILKMGWAAVRIYTI